MEEEISRVESGGVVCVLTALAMTLVVAGRALAILAGLRETRIIGIVWYVGRANEKFKMVVDYGGLIR